MNRYDLVDLTRQVLGKLANEEYLKAVTAFRGKNVKALNLHSKRFIQLIRDIDRLLTSDSNFLLGTWLESAKKLATNPSEMKQVRDSPLPTAQFDIHFVFSSPLLEIMPTFPRFL